jgi:preprotein translocase subunit SecA
VCRAFIDRQLAAKEAELKEAGIDLHEVERVVLLRTVDTHWMDHIDAMDQLRQGIGLRAYAQKDPVVAYTNEGFEMFDAMVAQIREEAVKGLLRVAVRKAPVVRQQVAKPVDTPAPEGNAPKKKLAAEKIGRNDPCPCGSGKKYKNCCGRNAK